MINPIKDKESLFYRFNNSKIDMLKILKNKSIFLNNIKDFFYKRNFIEINSPTLVESPGLEDHLKPFKTKYIDYKNKSHIFYLPTSPEFSLKEVLITGLENIFEIAKVFRNYGENSFLHRPEFLLLEWYRAYQNYEIIMSDIFDLLKFITENIYKKKSIIYKGKECRLQNFKKIKLKDLFKIYEIDLDDYSLNEERFKKNVSSFLKLKNNNLSKEDLFFKFFLDYIEPQLGVDYPTIIYEYPFEMAKLSELSDNKLYGKRFELYLFGIEIANGYQELTDYKRQKDNFLQILKNRKNYTKEKLKMPRRFLKNLKYGIPPCSGVALGLERLFMIFEDLTDINCTSLFFF